MSPHSIASPSGPYASGAKKGIFKPVEHRGHADHGVFVGINFRRTWRPQSIFCPPSGALISDLRNLPPTILNDKLRVVWDTTVFCGALVNPDGGNMQYLLLANGPFFDPVIAQSVLAEFVHVATVRGVGSGRRRRLYTYDEAHQFLEKLAPLLERAVPVGLRDILTDGIRWPYLPISHAFQNVAASWPTEKAALFNPSVPISTIDLKDAHVMLAALEHHADIIVTSNTKDFQISAAPWRVETPREFLRRWIISADSF
jgi:hypothetical protein